MCRILSYWGNNWSWYWSGDNGCKWGSHWNCCLWNNLILHLWNFNNFLLLLFCCWISCSHFFGDLLDDWHNLMSWILSNWSSLRSRSGGDSNTWWAHSLDWLCCFLSLFLFLLLGFLWFQRNSALIVYMDFRLIFLALSTIFIIRVDSLHFNNLFLSPNNFFSFLFFSCI